MCEEITKIYARIGEFEHDIEHSMEELWARLEALERKSEEGTGGMER